VFFFFFFQDNIQILYFSVFIEKFKTKNKKKSSNALATGTYFSSS